MNFNLLNCNDDESFIIILYNDYDKITFTREKHRTIANIYDGKSEEKKC